MALSIRLLPEELRVLAGGAIGAAYMGIGPAFENPVRIIKMQNLTDQHVLFSFDGLTDHDVLPPNGFTLLDVTTNKTEPGGAMYISQGTRIYAKELAVTPTSGAIYVSVWYGKHD